MLVVTPSREGTLLRRERVCGRIAQDERQLRRLRSKGFPPEPRPNDLGLAGTLVKPLRELSDATEGAARTHQRTSCSTRAPPTFVQRSSLVSKLTQALYPDVWRLWPP